METDNLWPLTVGVILAAIVDFYPGGSALALGVTLLVVTIIIELREGWRRNG